MSSVSYVMMLSVIVATSMLGDAAISDPTLKEWKETQEANADATAAENAKDAKMAVVSKVISMLEDLKKQVLAEGEEEAATYNKFACFCKTTQADKTDAIKTGKDDKTSLVAEINKLTEERSGLDKLIATLNEAIKAAEDGMKKATADSDAAHKTYSGNEEDMKAAISALNEAIKALKASKTPSLMQLKSVSETVKQAVFLADVLGIGGDSAKKVATQLLQQSFGDVPVEMEDYKFHSGSIIETLEKLLASFRKEKSEIDAEETKRVQAYDMLIQEQTDIVKAKTHELDEASKTRAEKIASIGTANQELTTTSATLLSDMEYLDELNSICSQKAKTWDQRSKVRADELNALTQATTIIKSTVSDKTEASTIRFVQARSTLHLADAVANSESAMEAIEAEVEGVEEDSAPVGFLQKQSIQKHQPDETARDVVMALLKGKGKQLGSALLTSLATRIAADPFAKVKKLIQELIERLLTEAANEASQKGWCDKSIADAKQKRQYAADEVEDLNAKMAKLEGLTAKLGEEIATLKDEIEDLEAAEAKAKKERDEEKAENAATVAEAEAGVIAINQAIEILDKFYKTSAKESVDLSLAQGPLDDAPKGSFEIGEAYKGSNAEAGGIIGMMEVIQSDFKRTITETTEAEKLAQEQYLAFTTETGKALAEKKMAKQENTKLKDDADANFEDAEDEMETQTQILATSIKELMELKTSCIDTGMSYADRVAMREEEISALKKALCILQQYAQYGPEGL
eukprot:CAMPEP_0169339716 /NCGR_PEP_ID=MMETSP1017-20121227/18584_1 /TAXON_ID=342587 /ORGANISM="Karlodinium micrum, Strain CCMP2283" /LENGTH=747 /DNA_ID=CAMNT_0009435309 /DNA_START=41 /DNA_END=2281 /DNA_ORIENTATION=-